MEGKKQNKISVGQYCISPYLQIIKWKLCTHWSNVFSTRSALSKESPVHYECYSITLPRRYRITISFTMFSVSLWSNILPCQTNDCQTVVAFSHKMHKLYLSMASDLIMAEPYMGMTKFQTWTDFVHPSGLRFHEPTMDLAWILIKGKGLVKNSVQYYVSLAWSLARLLCSLRETVSCILLSSCKSLPMTRFLWENKNITRSKTEPFRK